MIVTINQFDLLLNYDTASWAYWSIGFNKQGCVESDTNAIAPFLREHISDFKGEVVLLGLNRSFNIKRASHSKLTTYPPCANFHGKGHVGDGLLCNIVSQLTNIRGAFMTDLSRDLESDSSRVLLDHSKAIEYFVEQLNILGSPLTHIVCFGAITFDAFQALSNVQPSVIPDSDGVLILKLDILGRTLCCYKVIHYSYAARYKHQPRFRRQMEVIDQAIGESRDELPPNHFNKE